MKTVLHLPFPPTVNGLYSTNFKTKRRFKSEAYERWEQDAYYALLGERHRLHRHKEQVQVTYTFTPPDKRHRDVFNYEKAVSDFLVKHQILADDTLIVRGIVQWMTGTHPVTIVIEDWLNDWGYASKDGSIA